MKIKDVLGVVTGKVVVYRTIDWDRFEDLYSGYLCSAPSDILDMEIKNMSARANAVLDIRVGGTRG